MISVEPATRQDMQASHALVLAAGLPLDGLGDVPADTFVAHAGDALLGTVTVERHGNHALLRSLVVATERRGEGIGSLLAEAAEEHARTAGLDGVYLLTETAEAFFAARGYAVIGRDAGPEPVMASVEWATACGENAVPMVLVTR